MAIKIGRLRSMDYSCGLSLTGCWGYVCCAHEGLVHEFKKARYDALPGSAETVQENRWFRAQKNRFSQPTEFAVQRKIPADEQHARGFFPVLSRCGHCR